LSRASTGRLAALQRIRSEIIAVQFDEIEGVQKDALVVVAVTNAIEQSNPIVITGNRPPSMMQERKRRRAKVWTISGR
jgi:hypothetical protein